MRVKSYVRENVSSDDTYFAKGPIQRPHIQRMFQSLDTSLSPGKTSEVNFINKCITCSRKHLTFHHLLYLRKGADIFFWLLVVQLTCTYFDRIRYV